MTLRQSTATDFDSVSVVGLGKLGQALAICLASRGMNVVGIDIDPEIVDQLNNGLTSIHERNIGDLVEQARHRLVATVDSHVAITDTDATFFLVPTPSNEDGTFSSVLVEDSIRPIASALGDSKKDYHLFILGSTVSPDTIGSRIVPLIETLSGRKLGSGFGLCYCPEMVALGTVTRDFLQPDSVVIGESDSRAGDKAEIIYDRLSLNNPPVFRVSLLEAELAKISLNCYISLKISFGNMLAEVCECLEGPKVDVITAILETDRRIGKGYLRGGLPYGGPCFPRDTQAFLAFARAIGSSGELITACESINTRRQTLLLKTVLNSLDAQGGESVSVIGLSFKVGVPSVEGSPALPLVSALNSQGIRTILFDPLIGSPNFGRPREELTKFASSPFECVIESPVSVILSSDPQLGQLEWQTLPNVPRTIIDCWRVLQTIPLPSETVYVPLGQGPLFPTAAQARSD